MISGLIYRLKGTYNMQDLGGMYAKYPLLSLVMAISFFSLVGIPPLSGFWPKIALITESLQVRGGYWLVGAILFGTFITLYVIAKMWANVFWKSSKIKIRKDTFSYFKDLKQLHKIEMIVPIVGLAFISLIIGLGAETVQQLAMMISDQLIIKSQYIDAVLNN
jgi:multicomponent Na+:H+ antiporter subunit D